MKHWRVDVTPNRQGLAVAIHLGRARLLLLPATDARRWARSVRKIAPQVKRGEFRVDADLTLLYARAGAQALAVRILEALTVYHEQEATSGPQEPPDAREPHGDTDTLPPDPNGSSGAPGRAQGDPETEPAA